MKLPPFHISNWLSGDFVRRLSEFVIKYRLAVIVFFGVLGLFGIFLSSKLSIDSDLMKILPEDDPIIKQYESFISSGTSREVTYIALKTYDKSPDGSDSLLKAARAIFDNSNQMSNIEAFVRFDLLSDLGPLGLLLLDSSELSSINAGSQDLSRTMQRLINYDFSAIRSIGETLGSFEKLKDMINVGDSSLGLESYIRIPDKSPQNDPLILVMGFKLDGPSSDIAYVARVIPKLRNWISETIRPFGVTYGMTGDHFGTYDSHRQATDDFMLTTIISLTGISLLFLFAYSSFKITLFVFSALATSMFITLGIAYVVFGSLNIITSFVTAITLGLGIDYGIHIVTRLSDGAKTIAEPARLLRETYSSLFKPLITSMLTTAVVFVILSLIDAPAVRELGILTSFGIVVFFIVMFLFLPALSIKTIIKGSKSANIHLLDKSFFNLSRIVRRLGVISGGVVFAIILVLSYLGYSNIRNFSYTPPGLMAVDSEQIAVPRLIERAFGGSIMNTVPFMVPDIDSLRQAHKSLQNNQNVRSVFSILSILEASDGDQMSQLQQVTRQIDSMRNSPLVEAILKKAQYYDFMIELLDRAETVKDSDELIGLVADVIPDSLKERVLYEDENGKKYFVINAETTSMVYRNNVIKILFDSVGEDLKNAAGGYPRVFYHLMEEVRKVAIPVSLLALAAVFVIVSLERRNLLDGLKIALLLTGILLTMFGLMEIFGIETTFITVISAPLIIGIGVDALVYVVHGSGKTDDKELSRILKSITMSSATTMFAFFSFAFAKGKLISNFGLSIVFGVFMALVVASFLVPVLPWSSKGKNGG